MEIKIGDKVKLKSGGPIMVVEEIGTYDYDKYQSAKCIWFDKTKNKNATFRLESLDSIVENDVGIFPKLSPETLAMIHNDLSKE